VQVTAIAGDITTTEGRDAVLAACPAPDILVNNAGGPPPGDFRTWGDGDWHQALQNNMVTPIQLIKAVIDGMSERGFGRIVKLALQNKKPDFHLFQLKASERSGRGRSCWILNYFSLLFILPEVRICIESFFYVGNIPVTIVEIDIIPFVHKSVYFAPFILK
jgi:hypothetical protein